MGTMIFGRYVPLTSLRGLFSYISNLNIRATHFTIVSLLYDFKRVYRPYFDHRNDNDNDNNIDNKDMLP